MPGDFKPPMATAEKPDNVFPVSAQLDAGAGLEVTPMAVSSAQSLGYRLHSIVGVARTDTCP